MTLDEYVRQHDDAEPPLLRALLHDANLRLVNGYMCSGHEQGRLLKMFVAMVQPHTLLEVGTFAGYGTLAMAEALPASSTLYTYDKNDELEAFTRRWIALSPHASKIKFIIGDAIAEAPRLGIMFDMVFLDGDKRTYCEAYDALLPTVNKGGFIIADDTLWHGHVVDARYAHDAQTTAIQRFNSRVASDSCVEQVLLPILNGMTIIRKKEL